MFCTHFVFFQSKVQPQDIKFFVSFSMVFVLKVLLIKKPVFIDFSVYTQNLKGGMTWRESGVTETILEKRTFLKTPYFLSEDRKYRLIFILDFSFSIFLHYLKKILKCIWQRNQNMSLFQNQQFFKYVLVNFLYH